MARRLFRRTNFECEREHKIRLVRLDRGDQGREMIAMPEIRRVRDKRYNAPAPGLAVVVGAELVAAIG